MNRTIRSASTLVLALALAAPAVPSAADTLPVAGIVPRDEVAAVTDPDVVTAASADIPDDAWVLGVAIDGDARAYDLNLLNGHEVVNDEVDGTPVAVVWCPLAMAAMVYDRQFEDQTLTFEASTGAGTELVMRDRETGSSWSILGGRAIAGKMTGEPLHETALGVKTTWADWRERHPETRVLAVDGATHEGANVYADYFGSDATWSKSIEDTRLPAKTPVFAFRWNGQAHAVTHERAAGGLLWYPEGDGEDRPIVLIHRVPDAPTALSTSAAVLPQDVARSDDPEGLAIRLSERLEAQAPGISRLPGFDTYWYTWAAENPGTILIGK